MKKIKNALGAAAGLLLAIVLIAGAGVSSASADTTTYEPTYTYSSSSSAKSSSSSKAHSVSGVSLSSNVKVIAYIKATGITKKQKANADTYTLPSTQTLKEEYRTLSGGHIGWINSTFPKGTTFYKINGQWVNGKCANPVQLNIPKAPKIKSPKITGKVKIVKSFTWKVKATAKVSGSEKSVAKASINVPECTASGSASASASYSASASAYGTGRTKAAASAKAKSSAANKLSIKLSLKSSVKAKAAATARGHASTKAKADAQCKITKPTTPPPAPEKPVLIDVRQVNDVDVTNTTEVCATVSVPGKNQGTLSFTAKFGSFTTPKTFVVSGQVEKCATYQAPTEVPSGGTDTITYTIRDDVSGLTASDTTVFKINPAPIPPL